MKRPVALRPGDTVGIIAPASPPDITRLERAISFFTDMGLKVEIGSNIRKVNGYLAGTDEERLADLHAFVGDREVKAIVFACGGYGTARIAGSIDYELIRNNPKIIWGYSDITFLHTAIHQKSHLVTFHGPMPASDIADLAFDDMSRHSFSQLFSPVPIRYDKHISPLDVMVEGEGTGKLVGGNLSLLVSTLGTPFEIVTKGNILLIEDINEEPYRIDGMLNQLRLAGKLDVAAGVIVGTFTNAAPTRNPSLSLEEVLSHYLGRLKVPVMTGFNIGHGFPNIGIPLGVEATLRTGKKELCIQPGVYRDG